MDIFNVINQIGMFGLPLIIILLCYFYLTINYGVKLWKKKPVTVEDINKIIYLGIFGLTLGLFSSLLGIYEGTKIAALLRPDQLADGIGNALLSSIYGFVIFLLSASSWFLLRLRFSALTQTAK